MVYFGPTIHLFHCGPLWRQLDDYTYSGAYRAGAARRGVAMVETDNANPIYKRLTKDITETRRRNEVRAAVGVPVAVVAALSCALLGAQYNPLSAVFIGL